MPLQGINKNLKNIMSKQASLTPVTRGGLFRKMVREATIRPFILRILSLMPVIPATNTRAFSPLFKSKQAKTLIIWHYLTFVIQKRTNFGKQKVDALLQEHEERINSLFNLIENGHFCHSLSIYR